MLEGHIEDVNSVIFSYDGLHVVSASEDKTIRIWNSATGECVQVLEGHTDGVSSAHLNLGYESKFMSTLKNDNKI